MKSSLAFFIRPSETVSVEFDFLIGETSGSVGVTLEAGDLHTLYGLIDLNMQNPCVAGVAGPCGPLNAADGKQIDFLMQFNIESDVFTDGKRQIMISPVKFEFLGDTFLAEVVGPVLTGQIYRFGLEPDGKGGVRF